MSLLPAIRRRRFFAAACLSLLTVGCAGAKRNLTGTSQSSAKPLFKFASLKLPKSTDSRSQDGESHHRTMQLINALDQSTPELDDLSEMISDARFRLRNLRQSAL